MVSWGGGLIPILVYATYSGDIALNGVILTEASDPILTEGSDYLLIESV